MSTFTITQQIEHCHQLIEVLENTKSMRYDHTVFVDNTHDQGCGTVACAFGWAGLTGIGGLVVEKQVPHHPIDAGSNIMPAKVAEASADRVFGEGAWANIFAVWNSVVETREDIYELTDAEISSIDRQSAIDHLHEHIETLQGHAAHSART